MKKNHI